MNTVTIHLSDEQHRRAQHLAAERGETIETLMQEALAEYLEDLEDAQIVREFEVQRASGEAIIRDWTDFEAELDADKRD